MSDAQLGECDGPGSAAPVSLAEATRVWMKIGLLSFGGPAGQIALMHRILVDEKRWISERRFLNALNFCMLLPGPEAQQLATYVGWMLHRIRGGLIAGTLFILPGFAVILALSTLYVVAGDVGVVQGIFLGLKPAVIVIVVQALVRIARRSLGSVLLGGLAAAAFLAMFVLGVPFPYVIGSAAAIGYLASRAGWLVAREPELGAEPTSVHHPGSTLVSMLRTVLIFALLWLLPTAALAMLLGGDNVFTLIGMFFSKMAVLTFGGAYAVLAYVSQNAVGTYGWLSAGEMIDGLAMAETTPGPLILVTQFVGFVAAYRDPGVLGPWVAGAAGSLLTVWVTFVPCFLWIFLGAPHIEQLQRRRHVFNAMSAITAAVAGVIANLAAWFAIHALFLEVTPRAWGLVALEIPVLASLHWPSALIAGLCAVLVFRFNTSVPAVLAAASVLGVVAAVAIP